MMRKELSVEKLSRSHVGPSPRGPGLPSLSLYRITYDMVKKELSGEKLSRSHMGLPHLSLSLSLALFLFVRSLYLSQFPFALFIF